VCPPRWKNTTCPKISASTRPDRVERLPLWSGPPRGSKTLCATTRSGWQISRTSQMQAHYLHI
jgi:hypothetical protein